MSPKATHSDTGSSRQNGRVFSIDHADVEIIAQGKLAHTTTAENINRTAIANGKAPSQQSISNFPPKQSSVGVISEHYPTAEERHLNATSNFFRHYYGPFLLHWATKCVVALVYCAYFSVAIYGIANLKVGMEYSKLLLADDPVTKYLNLIDTLLQVN